MTNLVYKSESFTRKSLKTELKLCNRFYLDELPKRINHKKFIYSELLKEPPSQDKHRKLYFFTPGSDLFAEKNQCFFPEEKTFFHDLNSLNIIDNLQTNSYDRYLVAYDYQRKNENSLLEDLSAVSSPFSLNTSSPNFIKEHLLQSSIVQVKPGQFQILEQLEKKRESLSDGWGLVAGNICHSAEDISTTISFSTFNFNLSQYSIDSTKIIVKTIEEWLESAKDDKVFPLSSIVFSSTEKSLVDDFCTEIYQMKLHGEETQYKFPDLFYGHSSCLSLLSFLLCSRSNSLFIDLSNYPLIITSYVHG